MADEGDPRSAVVDTITNRPHLKRTLYAELRLSEKPSPDLKDTLVKIIDEHKAMLVDLNKKAAKR
ncbi:MAG: hypothetical protein ACRC1K_10855 [Planctomycetia bacterium]